MPQDLAARRPQSNPETHEGIMHDRDPAGSLGQYAEGSAQCGRSAGLHQVQPHRREPTDAISTLGHQPSSWCPPRRTLCQLEKPKDHQHDPSDSQVGEGHHSPISLALQGQDGGSSGESSPISMDCREPDPRGIVESVANSVISQHLATCEADFEATNSTALLPDQADGKDVVDDAIQIPCEGLGKRHCNHVLCQCGNDCPFLAHTALSKLGAITMGTWLRTHEGALSMESYSVELESLSASSVAAIWAFSEADLLSQQDILEFMTFIIDRLQPNFCLAAGALDFNTLHMCHIRCLTVKKATDLHQYSCGSSIIWTPIAALQSLFTTGMTPQVFVAQVTRQEIASF